MSLARSLRYATFTAIDILKGSPVRNAIKEIECSQKLDHSYSKKKTISVSKLLAHAVANCDYYARFRDSDLSEFPVSNKQNLIDAYDRVLVPPARVFGQNRPYVIKRTSGSTGVPLAVPQCRTKSTRRLAELKWFGLKAGYRSHDSLVQIRVWNALHNKSRATQLREGIYTFNCSKMTEVAAQDLGKLIQKVRPRAILGYASWIDYLSRMAECGVVGTFDLPAAIAVSEPLLDVTRERMARYFNCRTYSRCSNEEQGVLAQDLGANGKFSLNHANYFIELLRFDADEPVEIGELGRIVVTDLYNFAFPMIRYDTGDIGSSDVPACGVHGLVSLSSISGRLADTVYTPSGEAIHPATIGRAIKHCDSISEWQFAQIDKSRYELRIVVKANQRLSAIGQCLSVIAGELGQNASIDVVQLDYIPKLASGKHKPVCSEIGLHR